jgi:hypothetical protein
VSAPALPCVTNWRLHELWCVPMPRDGRPGWYVMRTFVTQDRVYFYVSAHPMWPSEWFELDPCPLAEWRHVALEMVKAKCVYLDKEIESGSLDFAAFETSFSNHWSVFRTPY